MNILGYAEDFPASEKAVSHGLSRVNGRIFGCLRPEFSALIVNRSGEWWKQDDLFDNLRDVSAPHLFLQRVARAISAKFPDLFTEGLIFTLWARLGGNIRNGDWLFCPCGSSPQPAIRAAALARSLNLRLALYLVDEFQSAHRLSSGEDMPPRTKELVRKSLAQAEAVFTITSGLADCLRSQCSIEPKVLSLPYPDVSTPRVTRPENQILFVGNASHFYIEGLTDLVRVLTELREDNGFAPVLKITLGKAEYLPPWLRNNDLICLGPSGGSEDLAREIASSALCFLPYSFGEEFKTMVKTSFPSKLLDYLAHAKHILCYAPEYSTSVKYFKKHKLETCLTRRSTNALRNLLEHLILNAPNHSHLYRKALRFHDVRIIRSIILNTLA
jgi:hypothetical protein